MRKGLPRVIAEISCRQSRGILFGEWLGFNVYFFSNDVLNVVLNVNKAEILIQSVVEITSQPGFCSPNNVDKVTYIELFIELIVFSTGVVKPSIRPLGGRI